MSLSKNFEKHKARKDVEQPKCFGTYEKSIDKDRKKCGFCWFAHDCKAVDPKKAEEAARKAKLEAQKKTEDKAVAEAEDRAASLMKDTKAALDEFKIKYKDDTPYPELKKMLDKALSKDSE